MWKGRWKDGRGNLAFTPFPGSAGTTGAPPPVEPVSTEPVRPVRIPLEIAASYRARTRGLLGRTGIDGAILLTPASGVHTFRMRFAIDVAYLDRKLRVIAVRTMPRGHLGRPRLRARHVLESEAGAMERWGLRVGDQVSVVADAHRPR